MAQRTPAAASPPFPFPLSLRKQKELRGSRSPRAGKFRPPPSLPLGCPGGAEGEMREERAPHREGRGQSAGVGIAAPSGSRESRRGERTPMRFLLDLGTRKPGGRGRPNGGAGKNNRVSVPLPCPGRKLAFPNALAPSALRRRPGPPRATQALSRAPTPPGPHVLGGQRRGVQSLQCCRRRSERLAFSNRFQILL